MISVRKQMSNWLVILRYDIDLETFSGEAQYHPDTGETLIVKSQPNHTMRMALSSLWWGMPSVVSVSFREDLELLASSMSTKLKKHRRLGVLD